LLDDWGDSAIDSFWFFAFEAQGSSREIFAVTVFAIPVFVNGGFHRGLEVVCLVDVRHVRDAFVRVSGEIVGRQIWGEVEVVVVPVDQNFPLQTLENQRANRNRRKNYVRDS
jgi:hypothetical protein